MRQKRPQFRTRLKVLFLISSYTYFIEVQLTYNVSGAQQGDFQLYKYAYIIFQISFHFRLLQDIDYNSPCYTVNLNCLLHIFLKLDIYHCIHTSIFKFMVYSTSVLYYTYSESMMPKSHHVHDKSKQKTMAMLIVGGNIELRYVTGGLSW